MTTRNRPRLLVCIVTQYEQAQFANYLETKLNCIRTHLCNASCGKTGLTLSLPLSNRKLDGCKIKNERLTQLSIPQSSRKEKTPLPLTPNQLHSLIRCCEFLACLPCLPETSASSHLDLYCLVPCCFGFTL